MIARLFPGRTRKMVKNKFTREEKLDEGRVTRALTVKIPVGAFPLPPPLPSPPFLYPSPFDPLAGRALLPSRARAPPPRSVR